MFALCAAPASMCSVYKHLTLLKWFIHLWQQQQKAKARERHKQLRPATDQQHTALKLEYETMTLAPDRMEYHNNIARG